MGVVGMPSKRPSLSGPNVLPMSTAVFMLSSSEVDVEESVGSDAAGATAVAVDDAVGVAVFCLADCWLTVFCFTVFLTFLAGGFPCTFSIASLVETVGPLFPFLVTGDMMMMAVLLVGRLGMGK